MQQTFLKVHIAARAAKTSFNNKPSIFCSLWHYFTQEIIYLSNAFPLSLPSPLKELERAPPCPRSYHSLGLREEAAPPRPPPPATHYYTDPLKNLPIFLLFHLSTLALTFYGASLWNPGRNCII